MASLPPLDTEKTFAGFEFGLDRRLTKALAKLGYIRPTLVQTECLPLALQGKDLLVRARTGSGKTTAYGLPLLHRLLSSSREGDGVRALILVPTKELVEQTRLHLWALMFYCRDALSLVALGDDSLATQAAALRENPDIVISTPSRLVSHLQASSSPLDLRSATQMLVVDEADLILSYGHERDVKAICAVLPKICQNFLMSATLNEQVEEFRRGVLHNPAILRLEEGESDGQLSQFFVTVPEGDKDLLLYALLKLNVISGKVLFFVNSVERCYYLKLLFEQFCVKAAVLNAELPDNSRLHTLQQFNKGVFDYLIATDDSVGPVADTGVESEGERPGHGSKDNEFGVVRGVDFHGVSFVVNVDFPANAASYTHRIGRTARGGASGTALSLVGADDAEEMAWLSAVQSDQLPRGTEPQPQRLPLDVAEVSSFRYRVEDVRRAVTKAAIKEARLRELKHEMLNSKRLRSYFEDNPEELALLRHDSHLRPKEVQPHMAYVPDYLIPAALKPAAQAPQFSSGKASGKRKAGGRLGESQAKRRKAGDDPLQSFAFSVDILGQSAPVAPSAAVGGSAGVAHPSDTGRSRSGRSRWKMRHRVGKFRKGKKDDSW